MKNIIIFITLLLFNSLLNAQVINPLTQIKDKQSSFVVIDNSDFPELSLPCDPLMEIDSMGNEYITDIECIQPEMMIEKIKKYPKAKYVILSRILLFLIEHPPKLF